MKVTASPRIYMGLCPKVVFSHQSLVTSNPQSLATHPLKYREKLDTYVLGKMLSFLAKS